jgi:hypothetical protein
VYQAAQAARFLDKTRLIWQAQSKGIGAKLERACFDVTISSASNARSRAIGLKLIFITLFHVLPAAAMIRQT